MRYFNHMTSKTKRYLTSVSGILGTILLTLYFTAPFQWMPLPPPDATMEQIIAFGKSYHVEIMVDTWLQQIGTILSVIFSLSLVDLAGTSSGLPGKLTLLAGTVITSLSLAEGSFAIGSVQAGMHGHSEASLACFELTNTFIHIFLLAPSLFLMMGLALLKTALLPKGLVYSSIFLGIMFQMLGVLALFFDSMIFLVIIILMLQNCWTIVASIVLLNRKN